MQVEVAHSLFLLLRGLLRGDPSLVQHRVHVATWTEHLEVAEDLLRRIALDTHLGEPLRVREERPLVPKHSHEDSLPEALIVVALCLADNLPLLV